MLQIIDFMVGHFYVEYSDCFLFCSQLHKSIDSKCPRSVSLVRNSLYCDVTYYGFVVSFDSNRFPNALCWKCWALNKGSFKIELVTNEHCYPVPTVRRGHFSNEVWMTFPHMWTGLLIAVYNL